MVKGFNSLVTRSENLEKVLEVVEDNLSIVDEVELPLFEDEFPKVRDYLVDNGYYITSKIIQAGTPQYRLTIRRKN